MSEENSHSNASEHGGVLGAQLKEVRYSYLAMMEEVEEERRFSVVGRELIDAVEIGQIFKKHRRKIKKS